MFFSQGSRVHGPDLPGEDAAEINRAEFKEELGGGPTPVLAVGILSLEDELTHLAGEQTPLKNKKQASTRTNWLPSFQLCKSISGVNSCSHMNPATFTIALI